MVADSAGDGVVVVVAMMMLAVMVKVDEMQILNSECEWEVETTRVK